MKRRLSEAWLAARMLCWLIVLPLLKRVVPLPRLVSAMWSTRASSRALTPAEIERISRIARWLAVRANPRTSGTCLDQSLVLYRVLSARRAAPELTIGVRRENATVGAHAWITVDGRPLGESSESLSLFDPIITFGKKGLANR